MMMTGRGREPGVQVAVHQSSSDHVQVAIPSPTGAAPSMSAAVVGNSENPIASPTSLATHVREIPAALAVPMDANVVVQQDPSGSVSVLQVQREALAGRGIGRNEMLVLKFRSSVRCLATVDMICSVLSFITLKGVFPIVACAICIPPALCAYVGAQSLRPRLLAIYIGYSGIKVVFLAALAFAMRSWVYIFFSLIQLWATRVVSTFYHAIVNIPPARLMALADPNVARFLDHHRR